MNIIEVLGLSKHYGKGEQAVAVFEQLQLALVEGRAMALTGPSGSGKSTLLNVLCGLEPYDSGQVAVLGRRAAELTPDGWAELRRKQIGVVFQDSNLMPAMTLRENVRLRADLAGRSSGPVDEWLGKLGLDGLGDRYPDQVSGGQRQRAALAMVFAMGPSLILADEPTGSLDRYTAQAVAEELFRWQRETGCSLVLATHDLQLAERCSQRFDLARDV